VGGFSWFSCEKETSSWERYEIFFFGEGDIKNILQICGPVFGSGRRPLGRLGRLPLGRLPLGRLPLGRLPLGRLPLGRGMRLLVLLYTRMVELLFVL
jgi:hypothetical protein